MLAIESLTPKPVTSSAVQPADADDHHEEALFIPQHVADRDLDQKGEAVPQNRDALQQDALAALGGLGAHQLGGDAEQLVPAGEVGGAHRAEHRGQQRDQPQAVVKHENNVPHRVHDGVGAPDDKREQQRPAEESNQAADAGGAARIEQILAHDGALAVAQRLEHADLGALLLDHAVHGGHADQRRHQEEEDWEDVGDGVHKWRNRCQSWA